MRLMVTGGAGFIGSEVVRQAIAKGYDIVCVDSLGHGGNTDNLTSVSTAKSYAFEHVDIRDATALKRVFAHYQPDRVMHLAAESHVDRSIETPLAFVDTNVMGTATLLETALSHWQDRGRPDDWRFHHISTDEVFGSLGPAGEFHENSPYKPNSPYAASKAASDHLVRAWHKTYGLPVVLSNCSNNYGPYQFPEKLIPVVILKALAGASIPVYGTGTQIRDWLYVSDHAAALLAVGLHGKNGRSYAIGGRSEVTNIEIIHRICAILDEMRPSHAPHARLISYVKDRLGHDKRYAINPTRIETELGWRPQVSLEEGLAFTVQWYLRHETSWQEKGGVQPQLGAA